MNNDNIEELLQRYGEDQRQQAKAAEHLRQLARRAARVRRGVACGLVLLAVGGIAYYRYQMPKATGPLVAERHDAPTPTVPASSGDADRPVAHAPQSAPSQSAAFQSAVPQIAAVHHSPTLNIAVSEERDESLLPNDDASTAVVADLPQQVELSQQVALAEDTAALVEGFAPLPSVEEVMIARAQPTAVPSVQPSRFRFAAGVGMAVSGTMPMDSYMETAVPTGNHTWMEFANACGTGSNDGFSQNSNEGGASDVSFAYVAPVNALSAHLDMAYSLVQNERLNLEVGLGIGGYSQQDEVTLRELHADPLAGKIMAKGEKYDETVKSLYVNVPLTFCTYGRGRNRRGLRVSLTPSHRIASSYSLVTEVFNPWKLTVGLGLNMPKGWMRSVSFTANLLPTYTNQNTHEFGISLDFNLF